MMISSDRKCKDPKCNHSVGDHYKDMDDHGLRKKCYYKDCICERFRWFDLPTTHLTKREKINE